MRENLRERRQLSLGRRLEERWPMWYRVTSAAIAILGCGSLLMLESHPGRSLFAGWALSGAVLVCGALQVILSVAPFASSPLRNQRHFTAQLLVAWLVAGAMGFTLIPLRVRVLASEPWLRPCANRLLRGQPVSETPRIIGLFRIEAHRLRHGVAYFSTGSYGLFGDAGLAFAPHGLPERAERNGPFYDHLYGSWWRYFVVDD